MPTEKPRYTVIVDQELLRRIDDFRFENRYPQPFRRHPGADPPGTGAAGKRKRRAKAQRLSLPIFRRCLG